MELQAEVRFAAAERLTFLGATALLVPWCKDCRPKVHISGYEEQQNTMTTVGYQSWAEWMGSGVLTLSDVWPENPRAMIVGLNPAPASVAAGHYYQGTSGNRQLGRLAAAGLFSPPPASYFEEAALLARVGFTDIVKRPSRGERDVSKAEISHGREILESKLAAAKVPLVICVFRQPVASLLGSAGPPGFQTATTSWGGVVFRMPGPFAPLRIAGAVMADLQKHLSARTKS